MSLVRDEDVCGLDVSMNDPCRMSRIEPVGNVYGQWQQQFSLQRLSRYAELQRHPIQELHGNERLPMLIVNFVDRADVGMIQCRGRLGFALEAAECLRVFGYIFGQELERHKATELHILGLVNHPHPTAAKLLDDAVVRNGLADHSVDAWLSGRLILRMRHLLVNE